MPCGFRDSGGRIFESTCRARADRHVGIFTGKFLREGAPESFAGRRNNRDAPREPQMHSATPLKTSIVSRNGQCVNSLYSSSRLVTLGLFRFAFPLEQELLGSKVAQGLMRTHAVVDLFPVSKLAV